jgi:hypothetical protein
MTEIGMACAVCGKEPTDCFCSKRQLQALIQGLGNLLVSFAELVASSSPLAINVANDIIREHEANVARAKKEGE